MSPREPGPERTCLGCRRRGRRDDLIRLVRGPDGAAVFDVEGRLPGRGAWVCPEPACVNALTASALSQVLRAPVRLSAAALRRRDLAAALRRRVDSLLTIARRMRGAVSGPSGVRAALDAGRARLVLVACDAPAASAAGWSARAAPVAVRTGPPAASLGALLGRGPADAAAVTVPGLAEALRETSDRWWAFAGELCDNENSMNDASPRAPRSGDTTGGG